MYLFKYTQSLTTSSDIQVGPSLIITTEDSRANNRVFVHVNTKTTHYRPLFLRYTN